VAGDRDRRVDDLEASAANALLKMLEEPPANTFSSWSAMRRADCCRRSARAAAAGLLQACDDSMTSLLSRSLPRQIRAEIARLVNSQRLDRRGAGNCRARPSPLESEALDDPRQGDPTMPPVEAGAALGRRERAERYAAFLDWFPADRQEAAWGEGPRRPGAGRYAKAETA
jgi:DNA polymerase-3 subunit delta'